MPVNFNWAEAIGNSPIFLTLVVCSVITLAMVVERAVYFWKRRGNPQATLERILNKVRTGETQEAAWACETDPHPLGAVTAKVFESDNPSQEAVEERLMVALSEQKMLLERNLGFLGTMAAIAPLIGLLGTVWGIMRAFQDMASTGSAAPSIVAAGVAEALTTTAAGLIVAVPAVLLYNHFTRRMNVMLTIAENGARRIRTAIADADPGQRAGMAYESKHTPADSRGQAG